MDRTRLSSKKKQVRIQAKQKRTSGPSGLLDVLVAEVVAGSPHVCLLNSSTQSPFPYHR